MEAKGLEGTVVADEVGITFHFNALAPPEKKAGTGRTIPWQEIASVTYTRTGKYSPGYLRVVRLGGSSVPKPNRDPQCLKANVGQQADAMALFADQVAQRLRGRRGAPLETEAPGTQRRGIHDARSQMTVKVGARRELRKLRGHLTPGEQVRYVAAGDVDRRRGLIALTDRRLLVLFHGHLRQSLQDIPLDRITAVRDKAGPLMGTLTVIASNTEMTVSNVAKRDMKNLGHALRTRMSLGSLPQLPAIDLEEPEEASASTQGGDPPAAQRSPSEHIEQLPRMHEQGANRYGGPGNGDSAVKAHFRRNWAAWLAGLLFVAPFGSLGDSEIYTGPFWLDILKFLGILVGLWALGVVFLVVHRKRVGNRSHIGA